MSPKLLRRMQSGAAYRVNVCMVIYPPRSQNLHSVWPTYRELWPQPCHTTARRLRETYKEIGASPSPSTATSARLCLKIRNKHRFRAEAKIFMAAVTLRLSAMQYWDQKSNTILITVLSLPTRNITVVFFIGYIGEYLYQRAQTFLVLVKWF